MRFAAGDYQKVPTVPMFSVHMDRHFVESFLVDGVVTARDRDIIGLADGCV